MIIGIPKEILVRERRVAATPDEVRAYIEMGFTVCVESGAGDGALFADESYRAAGAEVLDGTEAVFDRADVILKVKQPHFNEAVGKHEADMIRPGATLITFLHPASPDNHDLVRTLRDRNVLSFTMDAIPRISRAQAMDALSSMSTITGYKSVVIAAGLLPKFIPMIGTAIGATKPAKILVVGAGVVGLQAIASAKRLGGVVTAVDIRPAALEEATSVGAKVVDVGIPSDVALAEGGYARPLPEDWLLKEREVLAPLVAEADVVILSALVPSQVAPVLITEEMLTTMQPGSVIVDVSVDQGGNCAATRHGEETVVHGVTISGFLNIPGSVPVHASWLYAKNMLAFVKNLYKNGIGTPDYNDDIVASTLVTRDGEVLHSGAIRAMGDA